MCIRFDIYKWQFQEVTPSFQAHKNMPKVKVNMEYKIAESRGKLGKHFKNFSFDLTLPFYVFVTVPVITFSDYFNTEGSLLVHCKRRKTLSPENRRHQLGRFSDRAITGW